MAEDLRDKIARALFEKDAKHRTEKQAEWAWQNLLLRGEETYWHEAADAVLAVLDAETEWEYGLLNPQAPDGGKLQGGAHFISDNREHVDKQHRRGHPAIQFVRRRKAGPWEPVPEGEER